MPIGLNRRTRIVSGKTFDRDFGHILWLVIDVYPGISLLDFSILINWTSPFSILGVLGNIFSILYFNVDVLNKQTVNTLGRSLICVPKTESQAYTCI